MSYIRRACSASGWDGESNESMYKRFGMGVTAKGVNCGVVEWVKHGSLRQFGHVMRMNENKCVKRVNLEFLSGQDGGQTSD